MEVKASLNYLRIGPRKVRLVADLLKGKAIAVVLAQLKFLPKAATLPIQKLILSAVANAENNWQLKRENLYIKQILVNSGPVLHRWRPRAMGRATPIRKRTSHLTVILDEKIPSSKKAKALVGKLKEPKEEISTVSLEEARAAKGASKAKAAEEAKKGLGGGFKRKFFSRKTG